MLTSLNDVRAHIDGITAQLDPDSRYITELMAIVDAATGIDDLRRRLLDGSRGLYWAGHETFAAMTLADQLRVNLITNESEFMRFDAGELTFLRDVVFPWIDGHEARICSLPSANGEEAVSLAIECLEAGVTPFSVRGFDIQEQCIRTARSGRIPLSGLPKYVTGVVDERVLQHLQFDRLDVFADPIPGEYELIVCRNFLGYFKPHLVRQVLDTLAAHVVPGGFLMLDAFILGKHPEVFEGFAMKRLDGAPFFRAV